MTAFNPATCSNQDWAVRMASCSATLARCAKTRTERNEHEAEFAAQLHQAMGYRSEHSDPLAF